VIWLQLLTGDLTRGAVADWRDELEERQVPVAVLQVLAKCLASRAEKRLGSATVLTEELDRLTVATVTVPASPHSASLPVAGKLLTQAANLTDFQKQVNLANQKPFANRLRKLYALYVAGKGEEGTRPSSSHIISDIIIDTIFPMDGNPLPFLGCGAVLLFLIYFLFMWITIWILSSFGYPHRNKENEFTVTVTGPLILFSVTGVILTVAIVTLVSHKP